MEVHRAARRHGVEEADIQWAIGHVLATDEIGNADSPGRWLLIGTDRSGRLLELIVLVFKDGRELVIHAMPMRSKFERLLPMDES